RVLELGPSAGREGGQVVFDGPASAYAARFGLRAAASIAARTPRAPTGAIGIVGARANNLQNVTVDLPLGVVVAATAASGSGQRPLTDEVLYRAIARARGYKDIEAPGAYQRLEGTSGIKTVTLVDQAPLGRTSRGNPATYSGAWNRFRALFAEQPEAT